MLATTRNLPQAFEAAKSYQWREEEDRFRGIEHFDKTLGIVGLEGLVKIVLDTHRQWV